MNVLLVFCVSCKRMHVLSVSVVDPTFSVITFSSLCCGCQLETIIAPRTRFSSSTSIRMWRIPRNMCTTLAAPVTLVNMTVIRVYAPLKNKASFQYAIFRSWRTTFSNEVDYIILFIVSLALILQSCIPKSQPNEWNTHHDSQGWIIERLHSIFIMCAITDPFFLT